MSRCRSACHSRTDVGDDVLVETEGFRDDEAPAVLETASNHGTRGDRWGTGYNQVTSAVESEVVSSTARLTQAEWIRKFETANLDADINFIDRGVEFG